MLRQNLEEPVHRGARLSQFRFTDLGAYRVGPRYVRDFYRSLR